jgi:hypothetical protein
MTDCYFTVLQPFIVLFDRILFEVYLIAFDCLDLVAHRNVVLAVTSSISGPVFRTKDQ